MPRSAWTMGSSTTNDHMPTPPIVPKSIAANRRSHAYGDSTRPVGTPKDWADLVMGRAQSGLKGPRSSRAAAVQGCNLRGQAQGLDRFPAGPAVPCGPAHDDGGGHEV